MALLARCGEAGMGYRASCRVVVVLMTTDAGGVGDVVVVVDVAIGALARRHGMRSGEWEARGRVVEGCRLPTCRVVTDFAGLRESSGHVIRVRGALEILQVT